GNGEIAPVRENAGADDRHAKQRFRFTVARAHRHAALSALVRKQMAGRDPKSGRSHEADGGEAACFHAALSLRSAIPWAPPRNKWRVMFMKIGGTATSRLEIALARRTVRMPPDIAAR